MKFIKQHDFTDCGPACIAMIASHFNKYCTIGSIRENAKTDIKGTNFKGMIDAANELGIEAIPVSGKKEDIQQSLAVPFIAHVCKEGDCKDFKHYVVIKKVFKKRILVYDPSIGKKMISYEDFFKYWTGYVLVFKLLNNFSTKKENSFVLLSFLPLLRPHIHDLFSTIIASLLLSFFGIISSLYFKYLGLPE